MRTEEPIFLIPCGYGHTIRLIQKEIIESKYKYSSLTKARGERLIAITLIFVMLTEKHQVKS